MRKALLLLVLSTQVYAIDRKLDGDSVKTDGTWVNPIDVAPLNGEALELYNKISDKFVSTVRGRCDAEFNEAVCGFKFDLYRIIADFMAHDRDHRRCDYHTLMGILYEYIGGQIQDDSWNEDNHDILKNDLNRYSVVLEGKTLTDRLEEWTREHGGEPITTPEFFNKSLEERIREISSLRRRILEIIRSEQLRLTTH